MQLVLLSLFGVVGILSRYGIDKILATPASGFPISTFLINILGCFVAGLIFALGERNFIEVNLQTALLVGLCGGFTTFSAYGLQTAQLIEKGKYLPAVTYFSLSPILGLMAAATAIFIIRKFV